MHGRLGALVVAVGVVVLVGASTGDDDPSSTTTAPETTTTTAPDWRESQRQAVTEARRAIWLDGRPAPAPPVRLEVEAVTVEEIDGAQVAFLTTCIVSEQGTTFDIFGGVISEGGGYATDQHGEILGTVGGRWEWVERVGAGSRSWDGEAGCATD